MKGEQLINNLNINQFFKTIVIIKYQIVDLVIKLRNMSYYQWHYENIVLLDNVSSGNELLTPIVHSMYSVI